MADDERRAEIEAVAEAIHAAEAEHSWLVGEGRIGAWRFASDDLKNLRRRQARAALDRVCDARGDEKPQAGPGWVCECGWANRNRPRCSQCGGSRSPQSEDHDT